MIVGIVIGALLIALYVDYRFARSKEEDSSWSRIWNRNERERNLSAKERWEK